jgi:hypothetical protein
MDLRRLAAIPFVCVFLAAGASAWFRLDLEGGRAWSGYNDVRIPGAGGTKFSLTRDLKSEAAGYFRLRLGLNLGRRHSLSVLYAPLTLRAEGAPNDDLVFVSETFPAGASLSGRYTFNSYRLTYRYELIDRPRLRLGIGVTAKIRDAVIRIEGAGRSAEKANVGFVPLLNAVLEWRFSRPAGLLLEIDALAAPQGRAEDVFLGVLARLAKGLSLKAGYRFVEGGAKNDEVYTFALIHYLAIGAVISF